MILFENDSTASDEEISHTQRCCGQRLRNTPSETFITSTADPADPSPPSII